MSTNKKKNNYDEIFIYVTNLLPNWSQIISHCAFQMHGLITSHLQMHGCHCTLSQYCLPSSVPEIFVQCQQYICKSVALACPFCILKYTEISIQQLDIENLIKIDYLYKYCHESLITMNGANYNINAPNLVSHLKKQHADIFNEHNFKTYADLHRENTTKLISKFI